MNAAPHSAVRMTRRRRFLTVNLQRIVVRTIVRTTYRSEEVRPWFSGSKVKGDVHRDFVRALLSNARSLRNNLSPRTIGRNHDLVLTALTETRERHVEMDNSGRQGHLLQRSCIFFRASSTRSSGFKQVHVGVQRSA